MKIQTRLFVDGQWVEGSSGETIPVINPATGVALAEVQKAAPQDICAAIAAARKAFDGTWGPMNPAERSTWLRKVGDAILQNQEFLAQVEADDVGKPIAESLNIDVASGGATFHYFADICTEVTGALQPSPYNEVLDYTIHEPVGVVGAIIPWNFPFLIACRKIATALAAGNTIVIKPASWAPLSTLLLGEVFREVGVPAGVLNIVPSSGPDAGEVFANSEDIHDVTFTGSTEIGSQLYSACAPNLKACTLELGGKSPGLVLPDCDMEETVAGTLFGVFLNQGECCCGLTRLIVHEDVYDQFVPKFVSGAQAIQVGMPRSEETRMGTLIHPDHLKNVLDFVESGRKEGATILCGGNVLSDGELAAGSFMEPTVLADVQPEMRVWREEIFGPVVVVAKASSVEQMVEMANDSDYGLAASVWTTNLKTAHTLAPRIKAGTVWFNLHNFIFPSAPYGGDGASGVGRELGKQGLLAMTKTKNVMVSLFPEGFAWY
ncbi:MAG TPA: betaine-aldehyde dehydrogenase [Dehalococcoidia bacterium]|jgi:acyl-CoA reductase-like NAD-dependent aldehyde dehydrogenase|nr:aldehyde dehydrogenase family protein [SAR202 cluster bacterium]HCV28162.1 betaine-aldehyde dehydrogenase [Dehalococcoidia bacterium]HJN65721.1 aldehyde dehydrogenase family protein [Pirellulales bacterium]